MLASGTTAARKGKDSSCSHPMEGFRMLRLTLITISSIICTGIAFGGGLFTQIFAGAGVGRSLCNPGERVCDTQFIFVSQAFNSAAALAFVSHFIAGLIFDRAGGKILGTVGASLVALGFLVLQAPLLGAQYGHDRQTSGLLFWALLIADVGASTVIYVPMTMMWHLSDMQALVAGSAASTLSATAFLPILMSALMQWTGASLSSAMWVWLILVVIAAACFLCLVPTFSEYRAEAEKVLGTALPPADPARKTVKEGLAVLRSNWPLHLLLVVGFGASATLIALYTSLLGDWCMLMFGSSAAGERLGTIYNVLSGISGLALAPLLAYVSDNLEHGTPLLLEGMTMPIIVASVTIGLPTWSAQVATCTALALSTTFGSTMLTRYVLALAGPALLGTVYGLVSLLVALVFLALQTLGYEWMLLLPAEDLVHLRLPLQATCILLAACFGLLSARLIHKGLPERPMVLEDPKEALPLLKPRADP